MIADKFYTGDAYTVAPTSVRFDQESIEYNRRYNDIEYESLKISIQDSGQHDPIAINSITGLCEDGYTRTKICAELGIDVLCRQIDGTLDKVMRRELYMQNTVGREYSTAQKAVLAYNYMMLSGCKADVAAKKHKVSERSVHPVVAIAGLGRRDILDALATNGEWEGIKDVRRIATKLRKTTEVVETANDHDTSQIDYVGMINTAVGQDEFWMLRTMVQLSAHEQNMMIVKYLNMKYKLVVDSDTGEVLGE